MKILSSLLLAALVVPTVLVAQNLVPNPSFEEYTACPSTLSQFDRAVAWEWLQGSPDLFNECCIGDTVGVPYSFLGYQEAYEGQGYAGIGTGFLYSKEYIQAELASALIPGVPTYISMRVSPGGFGVPGITSPSLAASGLGMRFSVDHLPYFSEFGQYEFDTALVYMTDVLNDTAVWRQLSGVVIPDSAYRYIQVGNFIAEENIDFEVLDPSGDSPTSYAFVDAVCVSQTEGVCEIGNWVVSHSTYVQGPTIQILNDVVTISVWEGQADLLDGRFVDAVGRTLVHVPKVVAGSNWSTPFRLPAKGVYMLQFRNSLERIGVIRFLHVQP